MRPIAFHPAASREVKRVRAYYADVDGKLGDGFVDELEYVLHLAQRFPHGGRAWESDPTCRVFLLDRFPYSVVIELEVEQLRVLAVAHQHRRPGYWSRRR